MSTLLVIVALLGVLAIVIVVAARRRRQGEDTVGSFRRQIDALSPEARRPTIDQVKAVEDDESDPT